MIRSFGSEIAEDIFQGNWSLKASRGGIYQLEDCFLDLRILDAVAVKSDLLQAFGGRIVALKTISHGERFLLSQPKRSEFPYRIEFTWSDSGDVMDVRADLVPDEHGVER